MNPLLAPDQTGHEVREVPGTNFLGFLDFAAGPAGRWC